MELDRPMAANAATPASRSASRQAAVVQFAIRYRELVALGVILLVALFLDTWRLSQNGNANEYYTAAVLSATKSWKAFFFGSLDSSNFITIDKPPLALWPQAISARIFGLNAWSVLLPQAVFAVVSVAVLYRVVRITAGVVAALIAAAALALMPVSVSVARDNIPDSLLVLLLLLSAWAFIRAATTGKLLPLLISAALIGLAFNTKMLQAYLVLPAFVAVYAVCAPSSISRRAVHLAAALGVLIAVSGLWVGIVQVIPADARPYIGGSTDNSALNLVFGYNGIGRLTGADDTPGPGLGNAGPHFGGDAGITRLFNSQLAGEISWLIPLAIAGLAAGLMLAGRKKRSDVSRIGVLTWGGWFVVHAGVFSLQKGIFHPYYTAALAPGIAALVGIGAVASWKLTRRNIAFALYAPLAVAITVWWALHVLDRTPNWHTWMPPVLVGGAAATVLLWMTFSPWMHGQSPLGRVLSPSRVQQMTVVGVVALIAAAGIAVLGAPAAYALTPMDSAVQGVNPTATPPSGGGIFGRPVGGPPTAGIGGVGPGTGTNGAGAGGGFNGGRGGGNRGGNGTVPQTRGGANGTFPQRGANGGTAPGAQGTGGTAPTGQQGTGTQQTTPTTQSVAQYLLDHYNGETWLAATTDSTSAAQLILATGKPVMGMGGFNSTDPAPTVDQLEQYVRSGQLRYVVLGGTGGFGLNGQGDRTNWVKANCTEVTSSGIAGIGAIFGRSGAEQVYDCSVIRQG